MSYKEIKFTKYNKRVNPYLMPHNLRMQTKYMILDYERKKQFLRDLLYNSNMIRETKDSKKMIALLNEIAAVSESASELEKKYGDTFTGEPFNAVASYIDREKFSYFRSQKDKDIEPSKSTWDRYRDEFAYLVAEKLNLT